MRVLIIEDEKRLAKNIAQILVENEKYAVDCSYDGVDGLHMALGAPYDLILLDLRLPGKHGLDVLREIRKQGSTTPVLILTACDTPSEIVQGLDCGSDDYLTKPFDMGELVARCKALIRRSYGKADPVLKVGPVTVNTSQRKVTVDQETVTLTPMEYHTLVYLAMRAGRVVSKEELLEHLYDFNWERFSNVVEVYISSLRKKLDPQKKYGLIKTLRGQGYLLEE
ncbi:MAG: response regulator transcription factor [Phycisphaerae bacterium]|nr:response regulator transcription factor [Phycisphaerae bacterium]